MPVDSLVTELLYHAESYLKEFDARVTESSEYGVVLDRTAFYIGGGGQPSDTGILEAGDRAYPVIGINLVDGKVVHVIASDDVAQPTVGVPVSGRVDWERRYRLMRTHTALHILCGVVWRDYGALVTGGDMKPGEARMDFELEQMSSKFALEVEEKINAEVEVARMVTANALSRNQAEKTPDLIRTKVNLLPANIKEIRTIEIHGLDLQADGGTHVANTSEVGTIKLVGHESKGRINKRLKIALVD